MTNDDQPVSDLADRVADAVATLNLVDLDGSADAGVEPILVPVLRLLSGAEVVDGAPPEERKGGA